MAGCLGRLAPFGHGKQLQVAAPTAAPSLQIDAGEAEPGGLALRCVLDLSVDGRWMNPTPLEIRTTAVLAYCPMGHVLLHDFAPLCDRTTAFTCTGRYSGRAILGCADWPPSRPFGTPNLSVNLPA